MKNLIMIAALIGSLFSFAGDAITQNEDVKFIKDFEKAQRAAELAELLALDATQIETLTAIKADVDGIKADGEIARAEFQERVAETAAAVRANIEANGEFSEEDRAAMGELRAERRQFKSDQRTLIKAATLGLRDLLTEDQKAALKEAMQARRAEMGQGQGQGQRPQAQGQRGQRASKERGQRGQRGDRMMRKLARVLLSDAFHDALAN